MNRAEFLSAEAEGNSTAQVAARSGVSERTVRRARADTVNRQEIEYLRQQSLGGWLQTIMDRQVELGEALVRHLESGTAADVVRVAEFLIRATGSLTEMGAVAGLLTAPEDDGDAVASDIASDVEDATLVDDDDESADAAPVEPEACLEELSVGDTPAPSEAEDRQPEPVASPTRETTEWPEGAKRTEVISPGSLTTRRAVGAEMPSVAQIMQADESAFPGPGFLSEAGG